MSSGNYECEGERKMETWGWGVGSMVLTKQCSVTIETYSLIYVNIFPKISR